MSAVDTTDHVLTQRLPSVVAFGELLLRLDVPAGERLRQAGRFEARYTGAEANVAASLAGFGLPAEVVSVVPDDELGEAALAYLRRYGVRTHRVLRAAGRLGLLFHEPGGAGRPASVIYDRRESVFATTDPAAYDWSELLSGHDWLHLSGTAPALGANALEQVEQAIAAARDGGLRVSLDLNYRSALWTLQEAGPTLAGLLPGVDLLFGLGADAAALFGLPLPAEAPHTALAGHVELADRLRERFGLGAVAGAVRSAGSLTGVLVDPSGVYVSRPYPVVDAVGRIGTGDAFAAGLLRGVLTGVPGSSAIEFAAAAAHLKQSIRGDVNVVTVAEVEAVVDGGGSERVRR